MNHWLVKSEPDAFSWDQQVANGVEPWTGVRNHMAKANLMAMKKGDRAFFYHSNIGKEVVAICRISKLAAPDPTDETGRWVAVTIEPVRKLPRPVTLAEMKAEPKLEGFELIRQSRLSVVPVRDAEWAQILKMAG